MKLNQKPVCYVISVFVEFPHVVKVNVGRLKDFYRKPIGRRVVLLLTVLVNIHCLALTQNQPAIVSNVSAVDDTTQNELVIKYDLLDPEKEDVQITLKISNDNGESYLVPSNGAKGDLGFPISPGKAKRIVWKYTDDIRNGFKIKIVADDRYNIDIGELVAQVDTARIKDVMQRIYGERNHTNKKTLAHLESVRAMVEKSFTNADLQTKRQAYALKKFTIENVIGKKSGAYEDSVIYVLGAHMDTAPKSPGADDNASGVAGMLEAMRILSKYSFNRSIEFIAFDKEEFGYLGSQLYLTGGIQNYERIEGAYNFDMIGFYSDKPNTQSIPEGFETLFPTAVDVVRQNNGKGDFVVCTTNEPSKFLSDAFIKNAGVFMPSLKVVPLVALGRGTFTRNLIRSDHSMFWNAGYNAVHIGDGGETRNVNLDTEKDLMKDINYQFIGKIVSATVASLAELAQLNHCAIGYCDATYK